MSNYTVENLIPVTTPASGTPAIRIGDQVFPLAVSGGGGEALYKCATVTSGGSTWTGYAATVTSGAYSFSSSLTSGLSYGRIPPTPGQVYFSDGTTRLGYYLSAEAAAMIDLNTKFLMMDFPVDATGTVPVENHGLIPGEYIEGGYTSAYALLPASSLPSDVMVTDHDWSFEICFYAPSDFASVMPSVCSLFGNGQGAEQGRFDVMLIQDAGSARLEIGGVLSYAGAVVTGDNTFIFQRASDGTINWTLNGTTDGSLSGDVGDIRELVQPIFWDYDTEGRHGWPFRIRYIRISNSLRIV